MVHRYTTEWRELLARLTCRTDQYKRLKKKKKNMQRLALRADGRGQGDVLSTGWRVVVGLIRNGTIGVCVCVCVCVVVVVVVVVVVS